MTASAVASAESEWIEFDKIVERGDIAPRTGGRTYFGVGDVSLSGAGSVAFDASLCCPGERHDYNVDIWIHSQGINFEVMRNGDPAPGFPAGAVLQFNNRRGVELNRSNHLLYAANVVDLPDDFPAPNGSSVAGVWLTDDRLVVPTAVAYESMPAPGAAAGYVFGNSFQDLQLTNDDRVAFSADVREGASNLRQYGVWTSDGAALRAVAVTGQEPRGFSGETFRTVDAPLLNEAGQIAFSASTGDASQSISGLWIDEPAGLSRLVEGGDPAPGAAAGATFSQFSQLRLNERGGLAFRGVVEGSGVDPDHNAGLWVADGASVRPIVMEGQPAPGGAGWYASVYGAQFNELEDVLFFAELADDPAATFGQGSVWRRRVTGGSELLAQSGKPVPGMPDNLLINGGLSYSLAPNGDAMLAARLIDPNAPDERVWAMWRERVSGQSDLLFAGDVRDFGVDPTVDPNGAISNLGVGEFNDAGQFLVPVMFSYHSSGGGFSQAYYLATLTPVPEPAGLAWVALGGWALGWRRHQPC